MIEITMPKLSDTMTEGVLGDWKKSVGDRISKGDVLAEIETDKATMDLEAFSSGVLKEQRVMAGQTVAVGTVIALIEEQDNATAAASMPDQSKTVLPEPEIQTEHLPHDDKASPVVRRRAHELGVDLSAVQGTGPGGRVLLDDIESFYRASRTDSGTEQPAKTPNRQLVMHDEPQPVSETGELGPAEESQPLTKMRKSIIATVSESWKTIPHFSVVMAIQMDNSLEIRSQLKSYGIHVSLNDIIIKAVALAISKFPLINSSLREGSIILHREVNIGFMVAIPDGLLVPVIKGCQSLSLKEIATNSRQLISNAKNGLLRETDMRDGTFSLSNLGMYGVTQFSAVILPPQVAILAVGAVKETVCMKKGQPTVAHILKATLSADHRILDGAYVSGFLKEMQRILEHPIQLFI